MSIVLDNGSKSLCEKDKEKRKLIILKLNRHDNAVF